jgi:hypothetical protein
LPEAKKICESVAKELLAKVAQIKHFTYSQMPPLNGFYCNPRNLIPYIPKDQRQTTKDQFLPVARCQQPEAFPKTNYQRPNSYLHPTPFLTQIFPLYLQI